jgi:hypothetical protein
MTNDERFRRRYLSVLFDALNAGLPRIKSTLRYLEPFAAAFCAEDWLDMAGLIIRRHKQIELNNVLISSIMAVAATGSDYGRFCMFRYYLLQLNDNGLSAHGSVLASAKCSQWFKLLLMLGDQHVLNCFWPRKSIVQGIAEFEIGVLG